MPATALHSEKLTDYDKTNFTCSARKQTRKWRLKLTLVRLQTWNLMALGEGKKILCIKDHVRSCINDFRERIRAITFELKKKKEEEEEEEEEEDDDEQSVFLQFSENHSRCIFYVL